MQMKDLIHDFPLLINFEQGEEVRESVTSPVVGFNARNCDALYNVNGCDLSNNVFRWAVLVIPKDLAHAKPIGWQAAHR
jgi:hypothetical protein